jgi:hypothetical protein
MESLFQDLSNEYQCYVVCVKSKISPILFVFRARRRKQNLVLEVLQVKLSNLEQNQKENAEMRSD